MKDLTKYQKDLEKHLENTFNASNEDDKIKKLAETEKTVFKYIDSYLEKSDLEVRDIFKVTQDTLDEFGNSKIKFIK